MKKFKATARDQNGNKYAGIFEAVDAIDAKDKLKAEGYRILSLEEYVEAAEEDEELYEKPPARKELKPSETANKKTTKKAALSKFEAKQKKTTGLIKVVFSCAIFLMAIPLVITILSPGDPDIPAKDVLKQYFKSELRQTYDKQWLLLSEEVQLKYGTIKNYTAQHSAEIKKIRANASKGKEEELKQEDEVPSAEPGDIVPVHEQRRKAEFMTFISFGPSQEHYLARLKVEGNEWRIVSVELVNVVDLSRPNPAVKVIKKTREYDELLEMSGKLSKAETKDSGGIEAIRKKAREMLEGAYQQGKMTRAEYLAKKRNLEDI